MEITLQADYAIRAVLQMALHDGPDRLRSSEIAAKQNIPPAVLTRLLARLAAEGIVDAQRGVGGGVRLARTPRDTTLLDVVEAIDGPIVMNRCVRRPGECPNDTTCVVHPVWVELRDRVRGFLAETSFEDLVRSARDRTPRPSLIPVGSIGFSGRRP